MLLSLPECQDSMSGKEEKSIICGNSRPEVSQMRPCSGRPAWKKISSLPDMMVRPDERQEIKTFVNVSSHASPIQNRKTLAPVHTESFDIQSEKKKALDKAMTKIADRTTQNLRALLSPLSDTKPKLLGTVTHSSSTAEKCIHPSLASKGSDSASSSGSRNGNGWSPTKQPKKSSMKRNSVNDHAPVTLASTWHNPIVASKNPSMFERAAEKKKESRWDESVAALRMGQYPTHATQQQLSPLKTPQRHMSIDSISLASSLPPLTACDTDDCTLATRETESVDEQSVFSHRSHGSSHNGSRSQHTTGSLHTALKQPDSGDDELQSPIRNGCNGPMNRIVERDGSDCSPTTASGELQAAIASSSSDNDTTDEIQISTCQNVTSAVEQGSLTCPDITKRRANSKWYELMEHAVDVGKSERSSRSRSSRSRSLSPHSKDGKKERSRSRSLSLGKRSKSRSRSRSVSVASRKKERRSRSKSKSTCRAASSRSRSSGRLSSRRRSRSKEIRNSKKSSEENNSKEQNTRTKKDQSRRSSSKSACARERSTSKRQGSKRSTSATKRQRSKTCATTDSTSPRRHRSKSRAKTSSKSERRQRSSSRAKASSQSRSRSRSKSTTKRRQRKDFFEVSAHSSTATDHGSVSSGKVDDLLQDSYGSIEATYKSMYGSNAAAFAKMSSSLSALDFNGTKKHNGTKYRSIAKEKSPAMIPISSLLPPKKRSDRSVFEDSTGSLQLNDLETVSTSAGTLRRSGSKKNILINRSNRSDSDMPKSAPIRTGSTQELVRRWEQEIVVYRTAKISPANSHSKTMTTTKVQSLSANGNTIEWVETVLQP